MPTYLTPRELAAELALALTSARLARPYESAMLLALRPVCAPGLGTVAVRPDGVLLVDVDWWRTHTPAAQAGLLLHEAEHLLFDHAHRLPPYLDAVGLDPAQPSPVSSGSLANAAADLEINCGHVRAGTVAAASTTGPVLPADGLFPDTLSPLLVAEGLDPLPTAGTAEQYAARLAELLRDGAGDEAGEGEGTTPGEGDDEAQGEGEAEDDAEAQDKNDGKKGGKSSQPPAAKDAPKGNKPSPGGGYAVPGGAAPKRRPGPGTDCGSGGTGHESEAEADAVAEARQRGDYPDESNADRERMAQRRDDVAEAIRVHVRSKLRGDVPAHLARWAEDRKDVPVVPWHRLMRGAVRGALDARATGRNGRTYSRTNRRTQAAAPGGASLVVPGWHGVRPRVAVVVDTSGSMSDDLLARCLSEIDGALAAVPGVQLDAVACDTEATLTPNVRRVAQLKRPGALRGGGGTDLRVGIRVACERKPHALVVLTDGYTPWPATKPEGLRGGFVVGILDPRDADEARQLAPSWASGVVIVRTVPTADDNR
jgi:hypothetical protein